MISYVDLVDIMLAFAAGEGRCNFEPCSLQVSYGVASKKSHD